MGREGAKGRKKKKKKRRLELLLGWLGWAGLGWQAGFGFGCCSGPLALFETGVC